MKFLTLPSDAIPNAAACGHAGPYRCAGNLYVPPFYGQDGKRISQSPAGFKRGFWKIEVSRARARREIWMHGTSHIAIYEVAGMRRDITVRDANRGIN